MRRLFFWIATALILSAETQRSGPYEISLRLPPDGLYASEEMEIELHLADVTRPDPLTGFAPVIRATVEARIEMPSMPSMPQYQESAHPESVPGDYGIHPSFAHGGSYRLRLAVQPPGGAASFAVEFALEVADAASRPAQRARKPALPPRYSMEMSATPKRPKVGETVELRFAFHDREQPKQIFSAFEITHEALFHLVVVRADLGQFAHEHPQKQSDGSFVLRHRFAAGGDYRFFADVAPARAGSQILTSKLHVAGPAGDVFRIEDLARESLRPALAQGSASIPTSIRIENSRDGFAIRKTIEIDAQVLDAATHKPAEELENYLGAKGHFLLVHADGETFVHSHPDERNASGLRFLVRFPKPGLYRGWVQVQRAGKVLTSDFVLLAGSSP